MAEGSVFSIKLGAVLPDLPCRTTKGDFSLHEFFSREPAWTVLFSHPKDFTPVCTTELGAVNSLADAFGRRGVKLIGLSCDPVSEHQEWSKDVLAARGDKGTDLSFPMIADESREIAVRLGMLDPLEKDAAGIPRPARALFIVGPDKTNRATILYPATTGRSFAEVLRVVDSLFCTQDFSLATPANWELGQRLIVDPSIATDAARERFSNLEIKPLPSGKEYLRYVDCPVLAPTSPPPPPPLQVPVSGSSGFTIKLGASFPDFHCATTKGEFSFHEFLERSPSWTILFSHPKDFTPVCTTELGVINALAAEFGKRGVKLIGLSCDPVSEHHAWSKDVLGARGDSGDALSFPLIADEGQHIAVTLGMLDPLERDAAGMPRPARALFVIDEHKNNRLTILYPSTTGRNFAEVLRVLDSLAITRDGSLATPVEWESGQRLILDPSVPTETAAAQFENLEVKAVPSGKEYLRYVDCPAKAAPSHLSRL